MHPRRSHAERVALYEAFAKAVAGLSADAWSRLEARCASLEDPSFAALVRRGRLFAAPYTPWLPENARERPVPRAIAAFSRAVMQTMGITYELLAEFDADQPRPIEAEPAAELAAEVAPSGKPDVDAYVRASSLIESTLADRERSHPGVATAVRSAAQAVFRHDWLPPDAFDAAYRYVAPEIPFDTLGGSETRLLGDGTAQAIPSAPA